MPAESRSDEKGTFGIALYINAQQIFVPPLFGTFTTCFTHMDRRLLVFRYAYGFLLAFLFPSCFLSAQTVTNLNVISQHGQVFIRWTNISGVDSGFYYVYKNPEYISDSNDLKTSQYLGRIPFNFGTDFRLTQVRNDGTNYFLVTDDLVTIDSGENLFVHNVISDGEKFYYAVRCDYGHSGPNWEVSPGNNTTLTKTKEVLAPVKCYLQAADLPFPDGPPGEKMDVYVHYGTNVTAGDYPAMTNESCLPFHFGIVKTGAIGGGNACYMKFHGGGGDFFNNGITTHLDNAWKITFDDWIPAYGFDSNGANTRWLGYVESLDIYNVNISTPPPDSGIVKGYTLTRVNWELKWILDKWNSGNGNTIDTNRFYLIGTSQGCAGVLLLSMTNPARFAAGTMTVPKYDLTAPEDFNPDCKFNEGGSAVKQTRILFGDENFTNLQTDIPVNPGEPGVFRIYDLSNTNYTLNLRKNGSLPFLSAINGKNDDNTCWQEKIAFYNTVQATRTGGVWKWDLRQHNGIAGVSWSPFDLQRMKRFSLLHSYPAFSYTTFDGDPGSADVSSPPYYNGDDVGALHAAVDWIDSSIVDSSYFYQVKLFTYQSVLEDGSLIPDLLPLNAVTDVTIRRAQQFKNFAPGTSLCWMNFYQGKLIQSGVVNQTYDDSIPLPITVQRVRVFQDGSILRIMRCDSIQPTGMIPPEENFWKRNALQGPDDPIMSLFATGSAEITLLDITGRELPGDVSNPERSGSAMYSYPTAGFFIVRFLMNGMPIHLKCVIT